MSPTRLFRTRGRFSRKTFFLVWLGNTAQLVCMALLFPTLFDTGSTAISVAALFYVLATVWVFFCAAAKRWHDTNRSAVYALLMFVPAIGVAATLLLCLLVGGTQGPNKFGETSA